MIAKLAATKKNHGLKSASEAVRLALTHCDLDKIAFDREEHRQISVRIPRALRAKLKRVARQKRASAGELLRAAIESLPAKRVRPGDQSGATKR